MGSQLPSCGTALGQKAEAAVRINSEVVARTLSGDALAVLVHLPLRALDHEHRPRRQPPRHPIAVLRTHMSPPIGVVHIRPRPTASHHRYADTSPETPDPQTPPAPSTPASTTVPKCRYPSARSPGPAGKSLFQQPITCGRQPFAELPPRLSRHQLLFNIHAGNGNPPGRWVGVGARTRRPPRAEPPRRQAPPPGQAPRPDPRPARTGALQLPGATRVRTRSEPVTAVSTNASEPIARQ